MHFLITRKKSAHQLVLAISFMAVTRLLIFVMVI
jgi:hypothetical protein